jgi:apolipoprotein N-acyltransferase
LRIAIAEQIGHARFGPQYYPPLAGLLRQTKPGYTLIQANLTQSTLHDPNSDEDRFQRAARLSLAQQPGQRRVVLWSESGVPDLLRDGYPQGYYNAGTYGGDPALARGRLGRVAGPNGLLLTGNDDLEFSDGRLAGARNAVTAITETGAIRGSYAKAHLVPFGEYVPFRALLEPLGIDRFVPGEIEFWPGPGPRTLDLGPWGKVGVGICYEIIFPGAVTDRANRPDYLFNPSNEGWYGDWASPQFLAQTRLRAIEEGLPVLRSTTTGISAVIDASGVVRASIGPGKAERRDGLIPPAMPPTLFARWGNGLSLGWAITLLGLSLVAQSRVATRRRPR